MPSIIDQRLAARCHQWQAEAITRREWIAGRGKAVFDKLQRDLLAMAAENLTYQQATQRGSWLIRQAVASLKPMLADLFGKWIRSSYADARKILLDTVPAKWWRVAIRPHHVRAQRLHESIVVAAPGEPDDSEPAVNLTDAQTRDLVAEHILPSLSQPEVDRILHSPGAQGLTWPERLDTLTHRVADPEAMARELAIGISTGEDMVTLRKRIEPQVENLSVSAQRIIRTEGFRVANQAQEKAFERVSGDMLAGFQIVATMDQWTRPDHAARNGKLYERQGAGGAYVAKDGEILPQCPYAPNCRCHAAPVMRPPKSFAADPRLAAEFKTATDKHIVDPAAYDTWFARATDPERRAAVGTRRYQAMEKRLGDTARPDWQDFLAADGRLLSVKEIKAEQPQERSDRKGQVNQMLRQREELFRQVHRTGFVDGHGAGPAPVPTPLPEPTPPVSPVSSTHQPEVQWTPDSAYNSATIHEAQEWARANVPGLSFVNYEGIDLEVAQDINAAASEIARKFGIQVNKIGSMEEVGYSLDNPMAAGWNGIGINKNRWTGNDRKILEKFLRDDPHTANCSRDPYSYVAHEMAHVLHSRSVNSLQLKPIVDRFRQSMKQAGIRKELGGYAWDANKDKKVTSDHWYKETWAEAFSAYWADRASCSDKTIAFVEEGLKALYPGVL